MRRQIFLNLVYILPLVFLSSCGDKDSLGEITVYLTEEESEELLSSSGEFKERLKTTGFGGPMGILFQFSSRPSGRRFSEIDVQEESPYLTVNKVLHTNHASRSSSDQDTILSIKTTLPDCVKESLIYYNDGSYVYEIDFGNACEVFGRTRRGKLIETGIFGGNEFRTTTRYFDFGEESWMINGYSSFNGEFNVIVDIVDDSLFIVDWNILYSITSNWKEEIFNLGQEGHEKRSTVDLRSTGTEEISEGFSIIKSRQGDYRYDDGSRFVVTVQEPLVFSHECQDLNDVETFVSGVINGDYSYRGHSSNYSINYGDGSCDNLIIITENGESIEVDASESD